MPQLYSLPKSHKPGMPVRPVVSTCGGPTRNLSVVLERILSQLLVFVPAHLKSTEELIEVLKMNRDVPDGCIVVSLNVVGLYSNIPVEDSVDAAIHMLKKHETSIDMQDWEVDVCCLLRHVLHNNVFGFSCQQFRQISGIAMGNNLAPPLAILFMARLEETALSSWSKTPSVYKRFIGDCFMVWQFGL